VDEGFSRRKGKEKERSKDYKYYNCYYYYYFFYRMRKMLREGRKKRVLAPEHLA
jgi:CRISPR/Cas system-associated protein Csx1